MITIYDFPVPDEVREELQALLEGLERDGITDATVSMKDGHLHVEAVKVLPAKLDQVKVTVGFTAPEMDLCGLTNGVNPFGTSNWDHNLTSLDGTPATDITEDDVAEVVASGTDGIGGWDGNVAAVLRLKDGRFVAYETSWGPTGSGFFRDAYGGDATLFFGASFDVVKTMGLTDEGRRLCGLVDVTVTVASRIDQSLRTLNARRLIASTLENWATIGGEPIWAVVDSSRTEGFAIVGDVEPGQTVIASVTNPRGAVVVEWTDPAMKPPPLPEPVQVTCTGCLGLKIVRVTDPGEIRPRPIFCKVCNGTGLEWVRPAEE